MVFNTIATGKYSNGAMDGGIRQEEIHEIRIPEGKDNKKSVSLGYGEREIGRLGVPKVN